LAPDDSNDGVSHVLLEGSDQGAADIASDLVAVGNWLRDAADYVEA